MFGRYFLLSSILFFSLPSNAQISRSFAIIGLTPGVQANAGAHPFSFDAALNTNYAPQDGGVTLTPMVELEWRKILLKLRYNYEVANTFFASVGYDFGNDSSLVWWSIRPYFGTSFSKPADIAPELTFDIGYGLFGFSGDVEYLASLNHPSETSSVQQSGADTSQLYMWAEAYISPTNWMYTGITAQRNQFFHSTNVVDAGVIVGFMPGSFDLSLQASSFWNSNRYFILGVSYFFESSGKQDKANSK
jgi:hypothetical protein